MGGCRDRAGSVRDGGVRNAGPEEQLPKPQERGRADCSVSVRGRRKLPTVRHSLSCHGSAFPRTKVLGGGCTGRMHRPTTSLVPRAPPPLPQAARRRLSYAARRAGRAVLLPSKLRPGFGCGLGSPKSSKHPLPAQGCLNSTSCSRKSPQHLHGHPSVPERRDPPPLRGRLRTRT